MNKQKRSVHHPVKSPRTVARRRTLSSLSLTLSLSAMVSANVHARASAEDSTTGSKEPKAEELNRTIRISNRSSASEIEELCRDGVIKAFHNKSHHVLFCSQDSGVMVIELRDPNLAGLVNREVASNEDSTLISMFQKVRNGFKSSDPIPQDILDQSTNKMQLRDRIDTDEKKTDASLEAAASGRSNSFNFCNGYNAAGQFGLQICGSQIFAGYETKLCRALPSSHVREACEWYHGGYTPCGGMATEFVTCGNGGYVHVQILRRDSIGADDDYQTYHDFYTGPNYQYTFIHYAADWWGDTFLVSLNSEGTAAWVRAFVGFNGD